MTDYASKNTFQYTTTAAIARQEILDIGTASNAAKTVYVTDFKAVATGDIILSLYAASSDTKTLTFNVPDNGIVDFSWEVPYAFEAGGTTLETRNFYGSASTTCATYTVTGYVE